MSVSDLERSARLAHRPDAESEGNELSMLRYRRERDAGRVKLWADLDAVDGETVIAALERRAQQLFEAVPAGSLPRPWGERMATALVDQSAQQISADADPDRATVVVHVDASTGVAETEGGMVLDRSALEQMMCDARYQTVTHHSDRVVASTVIVDPPRWMRRLVINRDGGCMWPGCSNAIRYQVHHMRHVEHGGPTEMWNLVCLCTFHHKVVHRDHWTIRRLPDDSLVFIPERGRVLSKGPPVRRFLQD
jgi:hypothetical protein